jgi:hypothetical protein
LRVRRLVGPLLVALLLSGCSWFSGNVPPKSQDGLTPATTLEGSGIRFNLAGYTGSAMPLLTVTSEDGQDWSAKVERPVQNGQVITAKLSGEKGTARYAVENFAYHWTLPDGRTATGSVQYRDIRYRDVVWQVSHSPKLLVYHVGAMKQADMDHWTGIRRDKPLVIWVFPTATMLNDWARQDPSFRIAGQWMGDAQRLLVYDQSDNVARQTVLLHEMVHAVSPGEGTAWFEEGMARLFEARYERQVSSDEALRWAYTGSQLRLLHTLAQQREIATTEALAQRDPPTDPYTLGVSVWLFVKHYQGDAGVKRFIVDGGKPSGIKPTLEGLFHKDLPSIWNDWNEYLRGPDLMKDWLNP